MLRFILFLALIAVSTASCNRTCGETAVPYPFGFSPSCNIQLECTSTSGISLSGFPLRNFTTNNTLTLNISADCSRPLTSASRFFSTRYALTHRNGFFLRNCTRYATSPCLLPTMVVSQMSHQSSSCAPKDDNITCYFNSANRYMTKHDLMSSSCQNLFTSVLYGPNVLGQMELRTGIIEIGWWMTGDCRCVANASCTHVNSTDVQGGYWCKCDEGFVGDGYADGDGCRRELAEERSGSIIGSIIVIGSVAAVAVAFITTLYLIKNKRICSPRKNRLQREIKLLIEKYESLAPKRYSYRELKKITKSFQNKLGKGGYGTVYKGSLPDGRFIAVKVLDNSTSNGEEFLNETISIVRTSHVNVVSLLGFCIEGPNRALIFEYMPNGSLDNFIYTKDPKDFLGWEKLFDIAVGIAQGLEYLHRGCNARIVHFDIKPANILLDENFQPKVADFGLAKLCQPKESIISLAEMRGTIGYIAPEVFSRSFGIPSTKSDVYSYGMMLLEIVGGRKNAKSSVENSSNEYFPHWLYDSITQGGNIQAPEITIETEGVARKMAIVGLWCIQTLPANRPSMKDIVEMLEKNLDKLEMPPKPFLSSPQNSMMLPLNSSSS